jgi:UDP-2,3-diacylglucosamine hydrolase
MSGLDFIASDVHLGAVPRERERSFVEFLEHVGSHGRTLLLAGDLFDFWFEYGDVVPGRHFRVLTALSRLVDAGIVVTLAGGNHDAWGGRFLREEVGVTFHADPFELTIAGRRALVAHGDGLGRGDFRYRALKAVIRSRAAIGAFRLLHPEVGMRVARAVSSTEAKIADDPGVKQRAAFLEGWAADLLAARPELSLVVCGHAHRPIIREHGTGRHYVNAGDWLTHCTYVIVAPGMAPRLERWDQAARP